MAIAPDIELGFLMECHEAPFGIGRPADVQWRRDNPGASSSVDVLVELGASGYVEISTGWGAPEHREWVYANITPAGRRRINELAKQGVPTSGH